MLEWSWLYLVLKFSSNSSCCKDEHLPSWSWMCEHVIRFGNSDFTLKKSCCIKKKFFLVAGLDASVHFIPQKQPHNTQWHIAQFKLQWNPCNMWLHHSLGAVNRADYDTASYDFKKKVCKWWKNMFSGYYTWPWWKVLWFVISSKKNRTQNHRNTWSTESD